MIVIKPDGKVRRVKFGGDADEITKHIGCRFIDIVRVRVNEMRFDIFVDDEGLIDGVDFGEGKPKWNLKATHLRTMGWLCDKQIDWDFARKFPPLAGTAVVLGVGIDESEAVELDDATDQFVLSSLGEDIGMKYEAE